MSRFVLQTFAPAAAGTVAQPAPKIDVDKLRAEAYEEGFLAGQAAATEAALADQNRLVSDFVEAISDARMTNEAARRHVTATIAPTIAALCGALSASLADAALAAEIRACVERALAAVPEARPRLRCAPELAPGLAALLEGRGLAAEVEGAPELMPREAELHWDAGFDRIDIDACAAEIAACVASHLNPALVEAEREGRPHG